MHIEALSEVQLLQCLPRPVAAERKGEAHEVQIVGGQTTGVVARRVEARSRFALREVLAETTLDADALILDAARAHDETEGECGGQKVIVPGVGRKVLEDVEQRVESQRDAERHRATDEHSPRQVLTQGLSGGRSVFARHDGADEEGDDPQRDEARHGIARPVGEQVAQSRQQGGETQHHGGENEHTVDEGLEHHGLEILAHVGRHPARRGGFGGGCTVGRGKFGGHAVGVDAFEVVAEALCHKAVGRIGKADHVGGEEGGDDAHRHHDGVEVWAGHVERDTEAGDDEGKFADLCQREAAVHRAAQRMTGHHKRKGAENGLPAQDGEGDDEHGAPILHENAGIDHHAHRNEEDGAEKVLDRRGEFLDLFGFERLGQDATHHEGTESRGVAGAIGQHDEQKAKPERNDHEGFVVDQVARTTQEGRHHIDAHHKPQNEEETERKKALGQFAALKLLRNGRGRENDHEEDAENVFENQHRKHFAGKILAAQTEVVVGFVDDGGGRHGEHAAEKQTVGATPVEKATGGTAYADHAAHHHGRCHDGAHAHFQYLLDRKLQTEREHQEDDADAAPRLDGTLIFDRGQVGHVGPGQKTGHDVAQHEGLFETLEQHGDQTGHNEDESQVGNERRKAVHRQKRGAVNENDAPPRRFATKIRFFCPAVGRSWAVFARRGRFCA